MGRVIVISRFMVLQVYDSTWVDHQGFAPDPDAASSFSVSLALSLSVSTAAAAAPNMVHVT